MVLIMPAKNAGAPGDLLAVHRYLIRAGQVAFNSFVWIFVFQYFSLFMPLGPALVRTFFLYALAQTTAMLLIPFALRRLRHGMKGGMIGGALCFALASVGAGVLLTGLFSLSGIALALFLGTSQALYRVPYAVERGEVGQSKRPWLPGELLLACVPFLAGALLSVKVPPFALFFFFALLPLLALIPLISLPNVFENFSWNYGDAFGYLFLPEHRRMLGASMWRGVLSALLFLIFPIALLFATRSYNTFGVAFSATLIMLMMLRAGNLRIMTGFHADGGHYLDEYTALKEMGIALGALLFALICAIVMRMLL